MNSNKIYSAVLLDVQKAFDQVQHAGLIKKPINIGLYTITKLIRTYLTNRTDTVKVDNAFSGPFTPSAEVPQGLVLALVLYLICINDLSFPNHTSSQCLLYTDDQ